MLITGLINAVFFLPLCTIRSYFVQAESCRFGKQLTQRAKSLKADPGFSDMPACWINLPWINGLMHPFDKSFYRDQLTAHVAELERPITNLSRHIEWKSCSLLDQRDAAVNIRHGRIDLLENS